MSTTRSSAQSRASGVFTSTGMAAIIAAGFISAAVIHRPTSDVAWLVAYLVLVVGVAQIVFGVGQAELSLRLPRFGRVAAEWMLLNLGSLGVITGTLIGSTPIVFAGTLLFAASLVLFATGVRDSHSRWWRAGYWVFVGLIFAGSMVGLTLALLEFPL